MRYIAFEISGLKGLKRPKFKKTQVEKDPSLKRPSKEKDLL
jgi:hypothetical protein